MNYFMLWFWKPIAEAAGALFMLIVVAFLFYIFLILADKYRTYKIRKSKK